MTQAEHLHCEPDPPTPHSTSESSAQVAELQAELSQWVEKDRVREMEVRSLQHELSLYKSFNEYVETAIADQRQPLLQLPQHLETVLAEQLRRFDQPIAQLHQQLSALLTEQRQHFDQPIAQLRQQFDAALAEQRQFASWTQLHIAHLATDLHTETSRRQAAESELAAERSRVSYRLIQRFLRPLTRNRP